LEQIQSRDREKIELAASKGITLITIPCWWDGRTDRYTSLSYHFLESKSFVFFQPHSNN